MEWCIDANIAVKTVVKEHLSEKAKSLISDAFDTETRLIAPHFFDAEIYGAIRKKVYIGEITIKEGDIAFEDLKGLPVELLPTVNLRDRTWEIAKQFGVFCTSPKKVYFRNYSLSTDGKEFVSLR